MYMPGYILCVGTKILSSEFFHTSLVLPRKIIQCPMIIYQRITICHEDCHLKNSPEVHIFLLCKNYSKIDKVSLIKRFSICNIRNFFLFEIRYKRIFVEMMFIKRLITS